MGRDEKMHPVTIVAFERRVRLEWNNCPDEIRAAAEPHITAALPVLPSWVTEVNVFYETSDTTSDGILAAASVSTRYEYRYVSIMIHPDFLANDDEPLGSRFRIILHELSHALCRPLDMLVESLIEMIPESAHHLARRQYREAKETTTQDSTEAMLRCLSLSPGGVSL